MSHDLVQIMLGVMLVTLMGSLAMMLILGCAYASMLIVKDLLRVWRQS